MSRRKHAWEAYSHDREPQRVEAAVIEDFTDYALEAIGKVEAIAERTGNPDVALGVALAVHALLQTRDEWLP